MIDLIVEAGPQAGQRFVIERATVLGRGQFADLMISDLAVSRRHARLDKDGENWRLRDLKSANGTRHNGQLLLNPTRLETATALSLGKPVCVYENEAAQSRTILPNRRHWIVYVK